MRRCAILFSVAILFSFFSCFQNQSKASDYTMKDFEKTFSLPPAEYGGVPFWSWDEKMEIPEMGRQLDEFRDKDMGGVFIHARQGRITPYMGKEWMDGVRFSVDYAKKIGLLAYLYDEDRWPSGFAGGIVPKMNRNFRQKGLIMKESETPLKLEQLGPEAEIVKVFLIEKKGDALVSFKDVTPAAGAEAAAPPAGKSLMYFAKIYSLPSENFNGETYIDTMNKDAVKAFIDSTYVAYKNVVGDEFGKTVPAIFTDEPCYLEKGDFPGYVIPWTESMPDVFKQKYSYDIRDTLPLLFYDGTGSMKMRLNYWTNATEMFTDAYGKQIFDWTEKNNIQFTGHYMCEDNLQSQIRWIGAAMPQYEYEGMPGIDHLGRNINDVLTAKQVSSVAHQLDKQRVLSEMYGCAAWNFSFDGMKWIADWHYALGVNFVNQHLAWYTMRGCRKRDYPTCFQYQSPWWKYYTKMSDYIRRASYALTRGKYTADVLVIHPSTSAWASYSPLDERAINELNYMLVSLITEMSSNQIDYDLGDELIIARHGAVKDGKFVIGKMEYSTVVITSGKTLRATTVKLLEEFIAQGGKVVAVDPMPTLIDAEKPFKLKGVSKAANSRHAVTKLLPLLKHHVVMKNETGAAPQYVYVFQREADGTRLIFFANTDNVRGVDTDVVLPYSGRLKQWDLFTGKQEDYPSTTDGKTTFLKLHFEPTASYLFTINPDEKPVSVAAPAQTAKRSEDITGDWQIAKQDLNAVTLDFIGYRLLGDADWAPSMAQYMIQSHLEIKGEGQKFQLRYSFNIGFDPKQAKELYFVVEQPQIYEIELNGKPIHYKDAGWWRDLMFKKIDIRDAAVQGRNEMVFTGSFVPPRIQGTSNYVENGVEVENAYVVGDFSVASKQGKGYVISPEVDSAAYGNLGKQGFPFFSGSIVLGKDVEIKREQGEKVFLEFDGLEAITTKVSVNGKDAGLITFHPYRIDITPYIKSGSNRIEVELTDSNRNLMGPLHNYNKEPLSVGPGDFLQTATKSYNFVPFGITKGARIVYEK